VKVAGVPGMAPHDRAGGHQAVARSHARALRGDSAWPVSDGSTRHLVMSVNASEPEVRARLVHSRRRDGQES